MNERVNATRIIADIADRMGKELSEYRQHMRQQLLANNNLTDMSEDDLAELGYEIRIITERSVDGVIHETYQLVRTEHIDQIGATITLGTDVKFGDNEGN